VERSRGPGRRGGGDRGGRRGDHGEGLEKKGSSSFLKKRTKKLLFDWLTRPERRCALNRQKFFGSFFQKRTASFALALPVIFTAKI
jgi:hypothetical protein